MLFEISLEESAGRKSGDVDAKQGSERCASLISLLTAVCPSGSRIRGGIKMATIFHRGELGSN